MGNVTFSEAADMIRTGSIGIVPTDTLYGLVALASDPDAVERTYRARGREAGKPCVVLLSDASELERFGIVPDTVSRERLARVWPGKASIVFPCHDPRWKHLHRGTGTIAFRIPDDADLHVFLAETGPVIAPSANPAGERPAETAGEAEGYFGESADFVVDGGRRSGEPSTVARMTEGGWEILRQGPVILT